MNAFAALSALALILALAWSIMKPDAIAHSAPRTFKSVSVSDSVSGDALGLAAQSSSTPLGDAVLAQFTTRYSVLASQGGVSSTTIAQTAADIMPEISYKTYAASDVTSAPDTSLDAVIRYRSELRIALVPLLKSTTPEFEIYARYVDTGDRRHLDQLSAVAADYRTAIAQALRVKVPRDAVHHHVGILNAMSGFAATLDALVTNAADPIASVALLRLYNVAEERMFTSFDALGKYAAAKAL